MPTIRIAAGSIETTAELNDSATALAIYDMLPIEARGNLWGEEIYFRIPVDVPLSEDARVEMAVGELGYWPPGNAFCIFFGPTPASIGPEPQAASPVNPVGHVACDATIFKSVRDGEIVTLSRVEG